MSTLTCGRCEKSAETTKRGEIIEYPCGWGGLTLTGNPILNTWLCPECVEGVRAFIRDNSLVLEERIKPPGGVSDAMIHAFGEAWKATPEGEPGARRRAGLEAALAVRE